jgi:nucleotide-binding universal stress UspA family protein
MSGKRIVVGVDGSIGSALAVSWAVDECKLHNATLLIAHSPDIHEASNAAIYAEAGIRAIDRRAQQILTSFTHAASSRQPSIPVSSLLSHSDAPNALIDLSVDSELVVLGSHGHGLLERGVGRIVATQARCPVLVVPTVPTPDRAGGVTGVVHVVIDDPTDEIAAEFARREAAARGVPLQTVRWAAPGDPRSRSTLTIVGRGTTGGPWSTRPTGAADLLLDRLPGPVVVVGPMPDQNLHATDRRPTEAASFPN